MLKHVLLYAACLLGGPLVAETIGNVEFQFPPSNYEWKLLVDNSVIENTFFDDDLDLPADYQWGTPLEDVDTKSKFKIFTHREGDALEIFVAYQHNDLSDDPNSDDEEDDETDTLESIQKEIDQDLNTFLPNHRFILSSLVDNNQEGGFVDWEMNDGTQDIMHGCTRFITINRAEGAKSTIILGYLTTALQTECNRSLWANILNQARILD